MPDIASLIQNGGANPWLYLPFAIILGALHALEPGHSKSLMAAFIVAIRGTSRQAVLLGVSAAIGHTIVVWALALIGFSIGDTLILDKAEPWLLLISGALVIVLAIRLLLGQRGDSSGHDHHQHSHGNMHTHADGSVHADHAPHEETEDAHAAAHRQEIESRFAGRRNVTDREIAWFGFTGGLLPCPAAIAVLLVCLQLKNIALGISMVAAFSLGLAGTLVAVGMVAAWGTRQSASRWPQFEAWTQRIPLISGLLVMALGVALTAKALIMLGWL
jgi:nickel/cobalt transporter (NicO) family protein